MRWKILAKVLNWLIIGLVLLNFWLKDIRLLWLLIPIRISCAVARHFRWKVERKKVCSYTYYKLFPFKVVLSKKGKALETPICTARSISSMTRSPIFDR